MTDWASLPAPSLAEFEELAAEAFRRLPARFRGLCDGVVVRVEDFPDDETLREMGYDSPFDLLGLFRGRRAGSGRGLARNGTVPQHGLALPKAANRLLGRARGDARLARHPRPGARDRPSFRPLRRRHGGDRGGRARTVP